MPVTWDVSRPKEFWEHFLSDTHLELPIEIISMNELKALKPTKFWFKNNCVCYKDGNGYFYYINKLDLPNKKKRDEFEKFKSNDAAVLASMMLRGLSKHTQWYPSESAFLLEYKKFQADTPAALGSTSYRPLQAFSVTNQA